MKIQITGDNTNDEPVCVTLESLDNDAFVDLVIEEPGTITIPVSELLSALIAFDAIRSHRLNEEAAFDL